VNSGANNINPFEHMPKVINLDRVKCPFQITIGLREGYKNGKLHTVKEVQKIIGEWLLEQKSADKPYLAGTITKSTVVYAHETVITEPVAIYDGNVNPLYRQNFNDKKIVESLTEIVEILMKKLKQTRIYFSYLDRIYIMEK